MQIFYCFIVVLLIVASSRAFNFLVLHPPVSGSHVFAVHSISEELVKRGHSVWTVRFADPYDLRLPPLGPNHTDLVLYVNNSDASLAFVSPEEKGVLKLPVQNLWDDGLSLTRLLFGLGKQENFYAYVKSYCHELLGRPGFTSSLQSAKFDAVLIDLLHNECGLALADQLGVPVVAYWAFTAAGFDMEMATLSTPPSHVPAFQSGFTDRMDFRQRCTNLLAKAASRLTLYFRYLLSDYVISEFIPNPKRTSTLVANISGALINTDNILDYPRLQPETFINVGGLQINQNRKKLPQELEHWIQGAENGIILLTMGLSFDPAVVSRERLDTILRALGRLDQRVIVKFNAHVANLPKNVLASKFVPQQDILAHPKTRLFFTHCGMHGVMESIFFGVPMIGMPIFQDQADVGLRMKEKGIAEIIAKEASENEIVSSVHKVLNGSHVEKVRELSQLMRLRRHSPLADAVWLMEYVALTKGAEHLKLSSRHLGLIEFLYIDALVGTFIVAWAVKKMTRMWNQKGF